MILTETAGELGAQPMRLERVLQPHAGAAREGALPASVARKVGNVYTESFPAKDLGTASEPPRRCEYQDVADSQGKLFPSFCCAQTCSRDTFPSVVALRLGVGARVHH